MSMCPSARTHFSDRVLGFFAFLRSSISGCARRILQQPTSFAEQAYGRLSTGDAPFSQVPFSCGLQELAEAGTTRASPLAPSCLQPCRGSRGHPCKRYHGCYMPERHQPADRGHAAAAQHHDVLDERFLLNQAQRATESSKSSNPLSQLGSRRRNASLQALLQLSLLCRTGWYPKSFSLPEISKIKISLAK